MRLRSIPLALAGLALTSGAAIAREKPPITLERSSKWDVNYDADSFSALAVFGRDAKQVTLRLTWFEPSDMFQLMLIGKSLPRQMTSSSIEVTFNGGSATHRTRSINGTSGDLPMIIVPGTRLHYLKELPAGMTDFPGTTTEEERAVDQVDLRFNGDTLRLPLKPFGQVMAAVHTCTRALVKSWGFDPETQEALKARASVIGPPDHLLTSADYPSGALRQGANGLVRFRLDVDPDGRVSGCHILKGVQSPEFEKTTCDLVRRRARFEPALDATGKPIASYDVDSVQWRVEGS